jgi:hypothetical protein
MKTQFLSSSVPQFLSSSVLQAAEGYGSVYMVYPVSAY